jgi:hypothetical protein
MADAPIIGQSDDSYAPGLNGYAATQGLAAQQHLAVPGTVDLSQRQIIDMPGGYGSEYSSRAPIPGGYQMSFPTIYGGQLHDPKEAYNHALQTGQHLGIFNPDTPDSVMDEYENALHSRPIYVNGTQLNYDVYRQAKRRKISDLVK